MLIENYEDLVEHVRGERSADDFLTIYDEIKSGFARAVLLLFYISHIVIVSHPSSTFDMNYIQYFKAADNLRQKLGTAFSDALKEIDGLSPEWVSNCRFCTPRLLFYFECGPKNVTNIKKLEHNIEDRIYHILKKTRIISSTSFSLFAIPLNEEFVFMSNEGLPDHLGHSVRGLIQGCQPRGALQVQVPFCVESGSQKNFVKFLHVHIQQARNKGFDESVASSRHSQQHPSQFEVRNDFRKHRKH